LLRPGNYPARLKLLLHDFSGSIPLISPHFIFWLFFLERKTTQQKKKKQKNKKTKKQYFGILAQVLQSRFIIGSLITSYQPLR
jgi:hypothetical protein